MCVCTYDAFHSTCYILQVHFMVHIVSTFLAEGEIEAHLCYYCKSNISCSLTQRKRECVCVRVNEATSLS
jgi:hypothetical protein